MEVSPTALMLCMRKGKISDIERNVSVSEPVFHKQDEGSVGWGEGEKVFARTS
jgi:hypothetical protein